MTTYINIDNLPQIGDLIEWHENVGVLGYSYLVIGNPVASRLVPYSNMENGRLLYEFECIHLESGTKSRQWFEEDQREEYLLLSRASG